MQKIYNMMVKVYYHETQMGKYYFKELKYLSYVSHDCISRKVKKIYLDPDPEAIDWIYWTNDSDIKTFVKGSENYFEWKRRYHE